MSAPSPLRALLAIHFRVHFPVAVFWRNLRHGERTGRMWTYTLLIAVFLVPVLVAFSRIVQAVFHALQPIGQESALVGLAVLLGQMTILVLGLFHVIAAFYFSNDLERLIPLPVRANQVILSKLLIVLMSEYLFLAPVVLPILIGYGILAAPPIAYWLLLLPVYLLIPVIPLAVAALVAIALMRVVNLSRRKDALIIAGSLAAVALQLWIQTRAPEGNQQDVVLRLLSDKDGLVRVIGRNFPPAVWASRALTQGFSVAGIGSLLGLAGASAAAFTGLVLVAERLFYQGAIGLNEITARRRRLTQAEVVKAVSSGRHPVRAIFLREARVMNRTPVFLFNGMLVGLIVPVLFVLAARGSGQQGLSSLLKLMGSVRPITQILALALFFLLSGCLSGTASTTLSREGKHYWISKVIPVSWREQVLAKLLHIGFVSLVGMLTAAVAAAALLGADVKNALAALLLAGAFGAVLGIAGFLIDLARPQLKWTNPQAAIKQNFNVVFAILVDLALLAVAGFGALRLLRAGVSGTAVYLILLGAAMVLAAVAWRRLVRFAERRYPAVEG